MGLIDAGKLTVHKYSGVDFTKFADKGWHKSDEEIYAFKCGWNEALSMVSNHVSTVDAVEVVYCKACKFWYTEGQYCDRLSSVWEKEYTSPNDYCSRGERRENEKDTDTI